MSQTMPKKETTSLAPPDILSPDVSPTPKYKTLQVNGQYESNLSHHPVVTCMLVLE